MSHDPESRARPELAASDDSNTAPELPEPPLPKPGGARAAGGAVDPDGAADRPHDQSDDPYQPL